MRRVEKPWGHEIIWAETEDYVGKVLHINAGHRLSKQYHEVKEETVYVIKGVLYNYDTKFNLEAAVGVPIRVTGIAKENEENYDDNRVHIRAFVRY